MYGMNDNVALLGDWMTRSPSPRIFVSEPLGLVDENNSRPNAAPCDVSMKDSQENIAPEDATKRYGTHWSIGDIGVTECSSFAEQKSSRGGLVERLAARAGFSAPRLNTESVKSSGLLINSEVHSPYLTIPPGLSPTSLLESPILLSNAGAQPSPTTGQFPLVPNDNKGSLLMSEAYYKSKDDPLEDINSSSFAFTPDAHSGIFYLDQTSKTTSASLPHQSFLGTEVPIQADTKIQLPEASKDIFQWSTQQVNGVNTVAADEGVLGVVVGAVAKSPSFDEQHDEGDQKGSADSGVAVGGGAASEDGYNWRKYGQKQVKGSEYPRSYYKCTYPNCQVKKKVERSHEGHITEIIYKGSHNHPKPPPNRRLSTGLPSNLLDLQLESPEQSRQHCEPNGDASPEKRNDNMDLSSSAPTDPEFCNPNSKQTERVDAVDVSSTFSNDEDDDVGTHGSVSLGGYDGEGDETESKRRKLEASAVDMSSANRALREPRVVVQTTSDVDILDDGYRWRKYGQKVVKGNPNPRSYYKCTNPGCNVRKHVERASHDLKAVITTYEGKHNHDVPAARNSNHVNSSVAAQMNQAAATAVRSNNVHRPEPSQVRNNMARFETAPSFNSFGVQGRPQLNHPGFTFGMNHGLVNTSMAGFGSGQNNMPFLPVHPFLSHPQPEMNNMGFILPKEPKLESLPDPGLDMYTSSSLYQQFVGRLPLGPQM